MGESVTVGVALAHFPITPPKTSESCVPPLDKFDRAIATTKTAIVTNATAVKETPFCI